MCHTLHSNIHISLLATCVGSEKVKGKEHFLFFNSGDPDKPFYWSSDLCDYGADRQLGVRLAGDELMKLRSGVCEQRYAKFAFAYLLCISWTAVHDCF